MAGFVEKPKDGILSSAKDCEGIYGPFDIYFGD
jgi:hypothetical protein